MSQEVKARSASQGANKDGVSLQGIKAEHDLDLSTKGVQFKVGFKARASMVMDHRSEVS